MNNRLLRTACLASAPLLSASAAHAGVDAIVNGGFESGLAGWTRSDQLGSDGAFFPQTGTLSPVNGFTVPAPIEGLSAAMTDSTAGGSHALYQDIFIPAGVTAATLSFSIYINNAAGAFFTPNHLDWAGTALNQQARVDLLRGGADAFSIASADVLLNAFSTTVGSPAVTGYNTISVDVTALLAARAGETLRLRFAEVDNVNFFNLGIDGVSLLIVPAPSTAVAIMAAAPAMVVTRRRSR